MGFGFYLCLQASDQAVDEATDIIEPDYQVAVVAGDPNSLDEQVSVVAHF